MVVAQGVIALALQRAQFFFRLNFFSGRGQLPSLLFQRFDLFVPFFDGEKQRLTAILCPALELVVLLLKVDLQLLLGMQFLVGYGLIKQGLQGGGIQRYRCLLNLGGDT